MSIEIRPAVERGHFNFGWLDTWHTFSFSEYHDPRFMGFRSLRVINEDFVSAGSGFPTHPHRDMEIITYILEGELQHKDSMGTGSVIRPGDVQRMSAGTGVTHSEFNPSKENPVHLLQIWILPERKGIFPSYEQKTFPIEQRKNRLCLTASSDGADNSVQINQDARLYVSVLEKAKTVQHVLAPNRHAWLQVARGRIGVNGQPIGTSDGAAISGENILSINSSSDAEFLLFDLS
jgi:quercetin 2,3-dioxygenase